MIVQGVSPSTGVKDPSKMTDAELDHFLAGAQYGKQVASGQVSGMDAPVKDPSKMSDAELDAFIESKKPAWIDQPGTAQNVSRGFINALPVAGGIGGGLIGSATPAGPIGALAGSGLGYGAGESLKNTIYSALGSKDAPQTHEEALAGPLKSIPAGAEQEMGGQVIGALTSKFLPRVASGISNVPEQDIMTYANNPEEVGGLIKETKGNVTEKIDDVRRGAASNINDYKSGLNQKISEGLASRSQVKDVDISPILDSMEKAKSQINSKLNPEIVSDINSIQKRISDLTEGTNKASVSDINDIRSYLGDLGSGAVPKPTGEGKFFTPKDPGARAAYYGSGAAKDLLEQNAPEVADSLTKLGQLRKTIKQIPPGLLKEGANPVGFLGAGRGAALGNEAALNNLDEMIGSNVLGNAQKLSSAQNLGNSELNPLSLYSGGFLKSPMPIRAAIEGNQALGGAPAAAAQFSTRPAIMSVIPHRPDVKQYPHLGK